MDSQLRAKLKRQIQAYQEKHPNSETSIRHKWVKEGANHHFLQHDRFGNNGLTLPIDLRKPYCVQQQQLQHAKQQQLLSIVWLFSAALSLFNWCWVCRRIYSHFKLSLAFLRIPQLKSNHSKKTIHDNRLLKSTYSIFWFSVWNISIYSSLLNF